MTGIANGINNALLSALNMNSHLINSVTDPVSAQDVSTKAYVDAVAQGLNPKPASAAASTTALTVTYNNGTGGIGATLTNAGAQAALVLDGFSVAVNDVVLIKDQAATLQNGLYTVTNIGSGATNWVLTRSVYMDQPAEFKGGYTFVINGSTQAGRSYVETATVTAVGTDPVTFTQFSQSKQLTVTTQVFTSNGTYTPTTGMAYCIVELVGGGGGSGGAAGAGGQGAASAGGGGGGYCRKTYTATLIGANAAVVIGTGGTAGAAGNNTGGTGVNSTFTPAGAGAILTAAGGTGGGGSASSATFAISGNGGTGGSGTNGDVNIKGGFGSVGITVNGAGAILLAGTGGQTPFGMGTAPVNGTGMNAPLLYGSGGQGDPNDSGADEAGSAGADGICYITEFNLV